MTYKEKLQSPKWQKKRLQILDRDYWECQTCMNNEKMLIVHHKKYLDNVDPWEYQDQFLITLCETCHDKIHLGDDMVSCMDLKESKYVNHIEIKDEGIINPAKFITALYKHNKIHANNIVKKIRFIENHEGAWIFKTVNITNIELSVLTGCFDEYCYFDSIYLFINNGELVFEDCFGTSCTMNLFNV